MTRLLGINHVALEVGSVDEALGFLESVFGPLRLRGRQPRMAWVDMGDQFLAVVEGTHDAHGSHRHVGIAVDDRAAVLARAAAAGAELERNTVVDPWGNRLEVVDYREIQFTKAPGVLRALGHDGLEKTADAKAELRAKGIDA